MQLNFTQKHDAILDTTVQPQDDFFSYVNAKWIAANPIPDSETRWGQFVVLRNESWKAMHTIYKEQQEKSPADHTIEQQARDFYYSGMHYDDFKDNHLQQIKDLHGEIDAAKNIAQLSYILGTLHAIGVDCFWGTFVDSDHNDSDKHILHFHQAGLTLPDRDYYLDDTEKMRSIRKSYKEYALKVYAFFSEFAPSKANFWKPLLEFETAIATISRPSPDLRDVEKNYHKTTMSDLKKTYPAISWNDYARGLGWQADDKITVDQPEFLAFVNDSFNDQSIDTLKLYLKWRITSQYLGKVSTEFSELQFSFFGRVLSGTTEIIPLWKRVVMQIEGAIGDGVGRLYAERYFPEASKKQVLTLVEQVRAAYKQRLDTLDWMSEEHREYAKKKLANIKVIIGYPDEWRDFSGLAITRQSYLGNIFAAEKFATDYWLRRLHEPTSRDEWFMTPQTVNAYHDPNRLVICFPAGILQKPFFDPKASIASNMGGIGTVIGHELTHGFDDQGCMFDANGNVHTWQSDDERVAFDKKAQIIVDQADNFEVLPGLMLRGRLVLGESIADLGGIEIALHALKTQLGDSPDKSDAIQQFFINYAFTECGSVRAEKLREFTLTDPHPLSEFRVNGILQHVDDFYTAFDIHKNDKLYLTEKKRARIW